MSATKKAKWLATFGIDGRDARRLESALAALADFGSAVQQGLIRHGEPRTQVDAVCAAIRYVIDGWETP